MKNVKVVWRNWAKLRLNPQESEYRPKDTYNKENMKNARKREWLIQPIKKELQCKAFCYPWPSFIVHRGRTIEDLVRNPNNSI